MARADLIRELEREPLRNVVLLKQLAAFPDHTTAYRIAGKDTNASLVVLDTRASAYDRETYPAAKYAVMVSRDRCAQPT